MKIEELHNDSWKNFLNQYFEYPELKMSIDASRVQWTKEFLDGDVPHGKIQNALKEMISLESGEIANRDEGRMVGHYWLRNSELAPTPEIRSDIDTAIRRVEKISESILSGEVAGSGGIFKNYILIGIGGSALGPQLVSKALRECGSRGLNPYFFDNTDPDGIGVILSKLEKELGQTVCIVISKSGSTKETRNGMLEARAIYEMQGLNWSKHAIAVTCEGSSLDRLADEEGWLDRLPMWDWVGGRTSVFSCVGLLPAALEGISIRSFLDGARSSDHVTRNEDPQRNPAAILAQVWHFEGSGKGLKDMVILPYRDRLELFSKYLQQLVMESIGKEKDRDDQIVHQGISVFGNKGSTDQHAYVQQLREGLSNFFVTFIETLKDPEKSDLFVEPDVTSGDYLNGFYLGTREALFEKNRDSVTITLEKLTPFTLGSLIALYERTVGLYASLINVNAYHQPGVEAGKKAAERVIKIQLGILEILRRSPGTKFNLSEIAEKLDIEGVSLELVYKIVERMSVNAIHCVQKDDSVGNAGIEERKYYSSRKL